MSEQVSFGYEDIAPEEKTARVGAVFSSVAKKYDVMNDVMSGGLHRLWKDRFVRRVKPQPGEAILDMAGGTGDIAFRLAGAGAQVTVADINQDMLDVGLERAVARGLDTLVWSCQNAEELNFPARTFDAYTIAFGIRNVTHIDVALKEAWRVLKPRGHFLCLEFSKVDNPLLGRLYDAWSFNVIPVIGQAVTNDRSAYDYLVESIRRFPSREAFGDMIDAAGFRRTKWRELSAGIVTIHSAWKD